MNGLTVTSLHKRYPEFTLDISCEIPEGTMVSLLGPSGCGKSTTLSLITGIERPDAGSIMLSGRNITSLPPWERKIGIVFQDYALFPHMNVAGNIAYGLKVKKQDHREISRRTDELLELVGLTGYRNRRIDSLSGGEKQRIALARALAPQPELLLLDEPLSALDARLRIRLRSEVRRIQQDLGITTIYVTHDQDEAMDISDTIIVMNRGRVEQVGSPEEVYRHPRTLFTGTFIGASTAIAVQIHASAGNAVTVMRGDRQFFGTAPQPHAWNGSQAFLYFRPEDVRVSSREFGAGSNLFPDAVLQRCAFRGSSYEYYFLWEGEVITVQGNNLLEPGSKRTLEVPREKCCVLT